MKTAVITGISGQDGFFLSRLLKNKGYKVIGVGRRIFFRNDFIDDYIRIDLTSLKEVELLIQTIKPDETYHFAAQSSVSQSFVDPINTIKINTLSTFNIINAILKYQPACKFFFASSSEIFGNSCEVPQNEKTMRKACSPYGLSKLFSQECIENYRKEFKLNFYTGILYSHESPLRPQAFVSKKISKFFAELFIHGFSKPLELGNINIIRDWGYADDYVLAMWMIMQNKPEDYIISSNIGYSVKDFVNEIASNACVNLVWEGNNKNEVAFDVMTRNKIVIINDSFYRPSETQPKIGDNSKIKKIIGWRPKTTFKSLAKIMFDYDVKRLN